MPLCENPVFSVVIKINRSDPLPDFQMLRLFRTRSLIRNESEISCSFHPADPLKNGCAGFRQGVRSADLSSGNREDTEGRRDVKEFFPVSLCENPVFSVVIKINRSDPLPDFQMVRLGTRQKINPLKLSGRNMPNLCFVSADGTNRGNYLFLSPLFRTRSLISQ